MLNLTILFPFDYTKTSLNALRYAAFYYPSAKIQLVHVVSGLVDLEDPLVFKSAEGRVQSVKEEILELVADTFKGTSVPEKIGIEVLSGETVSCISNYAKSNHFDAIFMGSRDKYDLYDRFFGTTSLGVIKTTQLPVCLVPKAASYRGIKKVLVASDDHLSTSQVVDFLRTWGLQAVFLKFLHVKENADDTYLPGEDNIVSAFMDEIQPPFGFEIEVVDQANVVEVLLEVANDENIDLLITFPEKQSFFQALIKGSVTKALVEKSNIPMLFLPALRN